MNRNTISGFTLWCAGLEQEANAAKGATLMVHRAERKMRELLRGGDLREIDPPLHSRVVRGD